MTTLGDFVHLRVHSEYSIKDGLVSPAVLAKRAQEQGSGALAVTDLGSLFSAVKFYKAAADVGIKPVIGCEVRLQGRSGVEDKSPGSVVLLCMSEVGYRNLTCLLTQSYREGQDSDGPQVRYEWLKRFNSDLIVLSGGVQGDLGQALQRGKQARIQKVLNFWRNNFPGRYYLEIQRSGKPQEEAYLENACALAASEKLPVVATNEVCFLDKSDFMAHEVRVCINRGDQLSDQKRVQTHVAGQYLKTPEEMLELFHDYPEAVENTVEIARRCTFPMVFGRLLLPKLSTHADKDAELHLQEEARKGLEVFLRDSKLEGKRKEYEQRMVRELGVIAETGFSSYFLIVSDFVQWAKQRGIPVGPGRGSSAGSLVAFLVKITEVDPLPHKLLFERFLNLERISPPDIDVDFCMDQRDRVIEYVVDRYGQEHVSQIITFDTLAARAVVRDVGRVLGCPYPQVDRIAKLLPAQPNIKLKDALAKSSELKELTQPGDAEADQTVKRIFDFGFMLEGLVRNPARHAGGVIIAPDPLTHYTALYCERGGTGAATHLDMNDAEAIGLVKFDFLGLKTLTVIDRTLAMVARQKGTQIDFTTLPVDDAKVYRLLSSGRTAGVFQLESPGIQQLARQIRPDCFDDLVALLALFRPGPLGERGMIDSFVRGKHGGKIEYMHKTLKPILKDTYGVIVYQEQVMEIAQSLAGFSLGQADVLRSAMGKKKKDVMKKQQKQFVESAVERGVIQANAEQIFALIEKFAQYGFNKSHSVAYALVSYRTAWLKAHHTAAYMASLMTTTSDSHRLLELIYECGSLGIAIEPPDVNRSLVGFSSLDERTILYGLGCIRSVGNAAMQRLVDEREKNGLFASFRDFSLRASTCLERVATLKTLILAGALDVFDPNRAQLLADMPYEYGLALKEAQDLSNGQPDMFGAGAARQDRPLNTKIVPEPPYSELGKMEEKALGFLWKYHPVKALGSYERKKLMRHSFYEMARRSAEEAAMESPPMLLGIVVGRPGRVEDDRNTIYLLKLDDATGQLDVEIPEKLYLENEALFAASEMLVVKTRFLKTNGAFRRNLRAESVHSLTGARAKYGESVWFEVRWGGELSDLSGFSKDLQKVLRQFSATEQDGLGLQCKLLTEVAEVRLNLGESWRVLPCEEFLRALCNIRAVEKVSLKYPRHLSA